MSDGAGDTTTRPQPPPGAEQPAQPPPGAVATAEQARARAAPPSPIEEQRARFERARASQQRAPHAPEAEGAVTGAEALRQERARRSPQRARTRAEAGARDRAPRTIMEQLGRSEAPEDLAKLFDFAAERGLMKPEVARAAGAAVRAVGSVPSTARVVARAEPPDAPPTPAPAGGDAPPMDAPAPAAPVEPETIMGQPAYAVDMAAEPARAMAKVILDFAARHGMDLRTGDARVLFKGKSIEREVSPDLTVPLAEALAAAMAKRAPKGLTGASDPDKVLLALLSPVAIPLGKALLASAAGPVMGVVRVVASRARGLVRRRAQ